MLLVSGVVRRERGGMRLLCQLFLTAARVPSRQPRPARSGLAGDRRGVDRTVAGRWTFGVLLFALVCAVLAVGSSPVAVDAAGADPVQPRGGYRWPLAGVPPVLRPFDPPDTPYGRGHRGVDLGAAPGAPVFAAGAGVVAFAGVIAGRGVVSVQHPSGLRTTYEPVSAEVKAGAEITAGARLGLLAAGHPGCAAAGCLHWGLRQGQAYLDPLSLLGLGPVRLLPLSAMGGRSRVASSSAAMPVNSTANIPSSRAAATCPTESSNSRQRWLGAVSIGL